MVSRVQAGPFATLFAALLLFHATDFSCSAGTAQVVLVVRLRTDLVSVCVVGDIIDVERVESVHAP